MLHMLGYILSVLREVLKCIEGTFLSIIFILYNLSSNKYISSTKLNKHGICININIYLLICIHINVRNTIFS